MTRLDLRRGRAAFLAGIILLSVVASSGIIGAVSAQSSTYSKTFENTDSTRFVGIDTEGWGADTVRVIISTENGPGDTHVELHNETWTTAALQSRNTHQLLANHGAYETITIEVRGAQSEPEFVTGAEVKDAEFMANWFASTGGDRDLVADFGEKLRMATTPQAKIVDVTKDFRTVNESNLQNLDANETKLELYQSAASSGDTADNVHAIMNNHLQDAETVALIKGKNAYIRSLNQAGSKTTAEAAATENISEFYARQEMNLLSQWNSQLSEMQYLRSLASSETGVSTDFIYASSPRNTVSPDYVDGPMIESFGTTTYTLENGTTVDVSTVTVRVNDTSSGNSHTATIGPTDGKTFIDPNNSGDYAFGVNATGISAAAPTQNYESTKAVNFASYATSLSTIDTQATSAQNQMGTVVNQTYDQYQAGDINSSDLVDPYVLQNQFNPGSEYEGWATATLAMLGTNQPTNFSQTGYMNVTANGTQYQGILHLPENPSSGALENDTTYYPSNFTGPIYVSTSDGITEITDPFTVGDIRTSSGELQTSVTYVEKNYTTTSADELEKLNTQLAELRAAIESRESALAGGGSGLLGGLNGSERIAAIVAVALIAYGFVRDE